MFGTRKGAKAQARRDDEWRLLVRTITDPHGDASESDKARFRAVMDELGKVDPDPSQHDQPGGRERLTGPKRIRSEPAKP